MPVSKRTSNPSPYWASECGRAVVYVGDCRDVMPQMMPQQFHAVTTDPPYNLVEPRSGANGYSPRTEEQKALRRGGFMGKAWDGTGVAFDKTMWEKVLQLAKPGAHLLSFGGTRTWHRIACAIEDAGFDIRDTIMWVYGSGFPKSHDVSKAIDKLHGVERDRVPFAQSNGWREKEGREDRQETVPSDQPVTDDAKKWDGWGTCLKPAVEPIIVARKPLVGTVAQNTLAHGCGGINVDGCRIPTTDRWQATGVQSTEPIALQGGADGSLNVSVSSTHPNGRWPANLIHDGSDEVVELFPDGAARYFYTAKADDSDRPHGSVETSHPTVKPLDLMRYLVRLVCAKGGVVLDPFMGSGSTGCAAVEEGTWFVGIEQSHEYADIAIGRMRLSLGKVLVSGKLEVGAAERRTAVVPPPRRVR